MATVPRSPEAERHDHLLAELLGHVTEYNPDADTGLIRRAFDYACDHHNGQLRKSGEDFINHPAAVAVICAELKLDTATISAALLHDVVEDTLAELDHVRELFGADVALLVDGVTKLTRISFASREQAQVENYRKMIVAMAQDLRVVLIKLADRTHNMRTISALGKQKQVQTAKETLEIYAPLAHRLGIHTLKWELEDRAFQTLHPRRFAEIEAMVNQSRDEREHFAEQAGTILSRELDDAHIDADIAGRAKHLYSIYTKMALGGKEFNEIYDLTAMRVLVDELKDCYGTIGIIHSLWKPMPGRFKDYIAMPKVNMYQSLHTTVIGPQGKPLGDPGAHPGDAPDRRVRHRRALAVQGEGAGAPGRGRPGVAVAARRLAEGRGRPGRVHGERCGSTCSPTRCTCSRPRATSRAWRPDRRRSTSPTACTPTSAIAVSAPRSTAASCRCTTRSSRVISSRC